MVFIICADAIRSWRDAFPRYSGAFRWSWRPIDEEFESDVRTYWSAFRFDRRQNLPRTSAVYHPRLGAEPVQLPPRIENCSMFVSTW